MRFVSGFFAVVWLGFVVWAGITAPPRSNEPPTMLIGEQARLTKMIYGCDKEQFARLDELGFSGDGTAYSAYLMEQMLLGHCTALHSGDTLHVEDVALLSGLTKVRERGATRSWWVVTRILASHATKDAVAQKTGRAH